MKCSVGAYYTLFHIKGLFEPAVPLFEATHVNQFVLNFPISQYFTEE